MPNMDDCVQSLRRRIGDTSTPYTYDDNLLIGYITDAVSEVELDYSRGVSISSNLFTSDISTLDVAVFSIKAHYLFTISIKSQADRNNFRMVKGRLTLDNSTQSANHRDTLNAIVEEYKRMLIQLKNNGQLKGVRVE